MNEMIPTPDGSEPPKRTSARRKSGGDRKKPSGNPQRPAGSDIPSETDCLKQLARLAGLVAMGLLTPSQANAIRANYSEILRYHKSNAKEAEGRIADSDVMALLGKDPQLLNLLEPLLTSEQVAMIMKAGDDDDG